MAARRRLASPNGATEFLEFRAGVSNMDDKDLAKLDTFASGLKKTLQAARKRLRTASATADESDD